MSTIILNKMAQLKLHGMLRTYQSLLDNRQHHNLTHDEFINTLIQAEWEDKEHKKVTRHLKSARFRYAASIEELNFTGDRGLDKTQVLHLADGCYIDKKENLLITGPTGVGKSYLASALGHQACQLGYRTLYYNAQKLFAKLKMTKADGSYAKEIGRIEKQDLLIIDDFGLAHLDNTARMILMEIIEDRHGRKSTIIASQLPVAQWYEVIGESTVADAILDRMVHTAHRMDLKGQSLRKK
ncbi:IS21-like element helper ATPase IstB [Chitinophaga sancti]|uniref:IS21-like element helper ATPase IstB n=1 Tax=Chitinophaga sancti TaxID=1004 RepID=UPI002A75447C|nr:IS21-like element helper ATPase IstB [Chitinophaga sancti]WPQ61765.1 IS21-like element helper ATPase IstB [Chitinophaga sancti]